MNTFELPLKCPYCGTPNNGASTLDEGGIPQPGESIAICMNCLKPSLFEDTPVGPALLEPGLCELAQIISSPVYMAIAQRFAADKPVLAFGLGTWAVNTLKEHRRDHGRD